jgi:hypothetical protein
MMQVRSISLESVEKRLHFFFEMQETQNPEQQVAFPAMSPILSQFPLIPLPPTAPNSVSSSPLTPIVTLPASMPPRVNICPNCKKPGHSIDFCISPGGKMEGQPASDAIARQCAAREASRACNLLGNNPSNSLVKIESDGTVWIGGVKYQPATEPAKATIAEVDIEAAMTAADQGEYSDWAISNNSSSWGNNQDAFDMAMFLLAASDTLLIARGAKDPPLYLDLGASTHISCVRSDFHEFSPIEPRTITGVGNSSVSAIGMGTVEISIPETSAQLTLQNVLYAPDAGVRLISIS